MNMQDTEKVFGMAILERLSRTLDEKIDFLSKQTLEQKYENEVEVGRPFVDAVKIVF